MQTTRDFAELLKRNSDQIDSDIIKDLVELHKAKAAEFTRKQKRYRQEDVPIQRRRLPPNADQSKVNVRIPNDFVGTIVDLKCGYMSDITIKLDKVPYDGDVEAYEADMAAINHFNKFNAMDDQDTETLRTAAVTGMAARLLYADPDGEARAMDVDPAEAIFVYDRSIFELQAALRCYPVTLVEYRGGQRFEQVRTRVEWYTDSDVAFYIEDGRGGYSLDSTEPPKAHMMGRVPLIPFPNRADGLSDWDKVSQHIDAFDLTLSDIVGEFQQFKSAFMKLTNAGVIDSDTMAKMAAMGIIALPPDGEAEWMIKELPIDGIEKMLAKMEALILKFSASVDFADSSFAGTLPVLAYKLRLFALEARCQMTEKKFRRALQYQYQCLAHYWRTFAKEKVDIDPEGVEFVFVRNFPAPIDGEVQNLAALGIPVSNKTMWAVTSFIPDPEAEAAQIALEKEESAAVLDLGPLPSDVLPLPSDALPTVQAPPDPRMIPEMRAKMAAVGG